MAQQASPASSHRRSEEYAHARSSAQFAEDQSCLFGCAFWVLTYYLLLQAVARGMMSRADARRERRLQAAITIQRNMRMLKAQRSFLKTKAATLVVQSAWRGHVARSVAMDIRYVPKAC